MIYLDGVLVNDKEKDYFPDGTPAFNALETAEFPKMSGDVTRYIEWDFDNMGELFEVIALTDWLRSQGYNRISLKMPYIPNARMDRVKQYTDVFTLKTMCRLINDCYFTEVVTYSAHSNVSLAMINNIKDLEPVLNFIVQHKDEFDTIYLPDEGAVKRYTDFIAITSYPIVSANKRRDWKTAKILGLDIVGDPENVNGKRILFIDDIISRGGSLKFSAKKLTEMGAADIKAYIPHCENVVDTASLKEAGVTKIYTTKSIYRGSDPLIEIVE